jgi:hypothetical protein
MPTSAWMAIPLTAGRNRARFDADHAPDVGVLAREHALGLADPPTIASRWRPDDSLAKDSFATTCRC